MGVGGGGSVTLKNKRLYQKSEGQTATKGKGSSFSMHVYLPSKRQCPPPPWVPTSPGPHFLLSGAHSQTEGVGYLGGGVRME